MTFKWVPEKHLRIFQIWLLVIGIIWGIDYIITPSWAIGSALSVVEKAFPLWVWGIYFIAGGVGGLSGEFWLEYCRRRDALGLQWRRKKDRYARCMARYSMRSWPSYTAHCGLMALYASLGLGYFLNLIVEWHIWGLRAPVLMWGFAAAHWIFMNRRRSVGVAI